MCMKILIQELNMKKIVALTIACLAAVLLTSPVTRQEQANEAIAVIVHKDNPMSSLTESEVKLYYLRKIKKRWPGLNKNIRPADRKKPCAERSAFYVLLGMDIVQIERYFGNKQLQNAERPPDKFSTETEMINFVAEEVGGIGYIQASSVTPEIMTKVKVVFTR